MPGPPYRKRTPAPIRPIIASPGMASASATPSCAPNDPEAYLTHLLGHRLLVAVLQVARDHWAEDRIEAGLQLGGSEATFCAT